VSICRCRPAPAGRAVRLAGVVLCTVMLFSACRELPRVGERAVLELEDDTIRLAAGVRLYEVRLRTREGRATIEPARLSARPGDVVRFVATDALGYAIHFERDRLAADAAAFLDATQQQSSAPLLNAGAAWVVDLADAPAGEYPFMLSGHAQRGVLVVEP
jgi:plastocyanin